MYNNSDKVPAFEGPQSGKAMSLDMIAYISERIKGKKYKRLWGHLEDNS